MAGRKKAEPSQISTDDDEVVADDPSLIDDDLEQGDRDFGWDEGDAADRRKDPLRQ